MEIYFDNHTDADTASFEETVSQATAESLRYEGVSFDCEISVSFVTEDEIKSLNNEYRGIDEVTDVLSFPMLDGKDEVSRLNKQAAPYAEALGDIVICLDRAMEQAGTYGHGISREIGFLTAHSMLHLLGYDHMTERDEREMSAKQEKILSNINLAR